jgi:hypothetical protein
MQNKMQYLSGTGDFSDFNAEEWEQLYVSHFVTRVSF